MLGLIVYFLGAGIGVFLLSRLFFFLARSWPDSPKKLFSIYLSSLLLIILLGGYGMADGGEFAGDRALFTYGPVVLCFFVFDLYRLWKRGGSQYEQR
jgi:hypothetical protein